MAHSCKSKMEMQKFIKDFLCFPCKSWLSWFVTFKLQQVFCPLISSQVTCPVKSCLLTSSRQVKLMKIEEIGDG